MCPREMFHTLFITCLCFLLLLWLLLFLFRFISFYQLAAAVCRMQNLPTTLKSVSAVFFVTNIPTECTRSQLIVVKPDTLHVSPFSLFVVVFFFFFVFGFGFGQKHSTPFSCLLGRVYWRLSNGSSPCVRHCKYARRRRWQCQSTKTKKKKKILFALVVIF